MLEKIRAAKENESGFTLIELLIVIVILGVLAGIVVFAVGGINDTSKNSACKSDVKNVEIATESYYAQNKSYPTAIGATGDTTPTTLVGSKLLREAPDSSEGISLAAGGVVNHTCSF